MTFQQTPLSHTGTNYPYEAYIDTILKSSKTTQEGVLTQSAVLRRSHHSERKTVTNATDPYLKSEVKTTSIASEQYSFSADDIFQGLVPNKLIVGLMSSAAYIVDYFKSPFYFRHYDSSSVGFYVDGQSYPAQPLQHNYETDKFVDCYRMLILFRNDVNVDRYDYKEGYCLYVLEVDPYYSFSIERKGHCRLELKFAKPLPQSVTLILYVTVPEILHIDHRDRCL